MHQIYLDNSATTAADETVAKKICGVLTENYGNPSSLHGMGSQAYESLGMARHQAAKMIAAQTSRVYFTSGGTESNNLAIFGGAYGNRETGNRILTTEIEHSSVLSPFAELEKDGFAVTKIQPEQAGARRITAKSILDAVDSRTALVSFMFVNNETGEVLPVREIIEGVRKKNPSTLIHCDCVQGFGKLPFKLFDYDVDLLSASAHKLHGPKGVGCLYIKDRNRFAPRLFGGNQESGVKPGTENTALAAGFGLACDQALVRIQENGKQAGELRTRLLSGLSAFPNVQINSPPDGSPYILNFSLLGHPSSEIVSALSGKGIYISAGSACSKGVQSHVLKAMGFPEDLLESALRVSFSARSIAEEVDLFLAALDELNKNGRGES